jgi:hypothetical protein
VFNPFPGLRPFEPDEDHLFFGREKEIDDLLRRLRTTRFLSVIGTSGSGKSSLIRSGLIPSLHSGSMVSAGSSWRIAMLRPGENPIAHLAAALNAAGALGTDDPELAGTNAVMLDATLRRGDLGLVDAVRQAGVPPADNLLIVVDQFEELFRFRRSRQADSRDEAIAFVRLLLSAAEQTGAPIYVVLTMRSDFIGDCMEFPGLPEAVNNGQYLVPRMTRDELRSAIRGPVAVGGGTIAPRLVLRLLNEVGDDQDQLPVLQHALMRTWDHWARNRQPGAAIDMADYEAIGTMRAALSRHAEEAYEDTGSDGGRRIAEQLFKALTDTVSDPRGVRRPTSIAELAAICEAPERDVIAVVDVFRRPGRSFVMPPSAVPLTARSIVDLSHESLMRCWERLIAWAEEERAAAAVYVRLSQSASWFDAGAAGLWRDPELALGLRWKRDNRPTRAWGSRYDAAFDRAMAFLDRSEAEAARVQAERERDRKRSLRRAQAVAVVFGALFLIAGVFGYFAYRESVRASNNLRLARSAVDETLSSADIDPARMGADMPELQAFRKSLLLKAQTFYNEFLKQDPRGEELRAELGYAHIRLGHINRMLGSAAAAEKEYQAAIDQFTSLGAGRTNAEYQRALATAYNWLGETLRAGATDRSAAAAQAYNAAIGLQQDLLKEPGDLAPRQQELARSYYNRGILRANAAAPGDEAFRGAEADFREAIRLLEPLSASGASLTPPPALDLARAYNNLGSLLAYDDTHLPEARALSEQAIQLHEALSKADPSNRQYTAELATFYENLADVLRRLSLFGLAQQRSGQAVDLFNGLVRPAPSLGIDLADAHNVRAQIFEPAQPARSEVESRRAFEILDQLAGDPNAVHLAQFHTRFGELLLNLAALSSAHPDLAAVRELVDRAMGRYLDVANQSVAAGAAADARSADDNLAQVLSRMSPQDQSRFRKSIQALHDSISRRE